MDEIIELRNNTISNINTFKVKGSLNIAKSTADFLHHVVLKYEWKTARELLQFIENESKNLVEALPVHAVISNITAQIKQIIHEEYINAVTITRPAIIQRFLKETQDRNFGEEKLENLEEAILDHIGEFQTELDLSVHNITEQSIKHIYSSDIIMTIGYSSLVESFIINSSLDKKTQFEVVIIERAPFCDGHIMAKNLAKKGITTTLIPDSSIFALMPRINKVIISTNLILTNGGLKAPTGIHNLALTAKYHSVPVIVLAPSYKFVSKNQSDIIANEQICDLYANPQGVLNFSQKTCTNVKVLNPVFEYVPPEYVTLLISNIGVHESLI